MLIARGGTGPRCTRWFRALFVVGFAQLLTLASLSAQPNGLTSRPSAAPYLNMPPTPPVPSGDFITELAFPNLTFQNAVFLTHAPRTGLLYVLEREGRIYSFQNDPGTSSKTLVLDISAQTQGWDDCGLLGLAFHPDWGLGQASPNSGYFYVHYQYNDSPVPGPGRPPAATPAFNRLSRFTVPEGSFVADPGSELVLIIEHDRHVWHNGGAMFFHPVDQFLYFTIGDEGAANDSYDSVQKHDDKLFGGVFRIDVDMRGGSISHPIRRQPQSYSGRPSYTQNYFIPNDNPWQDTNGGRLEEFYAHGIRSPHRMTHDALSDLILLGDVGQGSWEEVSVIEREGNYQWPYKEGFQNGSRSPPSTIIGNEKPPIYDYPHGSSTVFHGNCVVGGYIYRGTEHPDLYGLYLFGDNTRGRIWSMDLSGNPPTVTHLCNMPSGSNYRGLSSFGLDANGEIYMCKMNHTDPGAIYKLGRTGTSGPPIPTTLSQTGAFTDVANLIPAPSLIPYTVASPLWSDAALKIRYIAVPDGEQITFTETGEWTFPPGTVIVKHFELVDDEVIGSIRRLETRLLVVKPDGKVYGVTYKWRSDNSDADLLLNGLEEDIDITTATGSRNQVWQYPSSSQCLNCHNESAKEVLGVKTRQLNCDLSYPGSGVTDNQLRAWNNVGLFDEVINEPDIPTFDNLVPLTDTGATLEHRVRSYLDANCGHCHRPGHVQAFFDANFDTPLGSQGLIDGVVGNDFGIDNAAVVRAKDIWRSILYVRDNSLDPFVKMPPLGKNMIDSNWIPTLAAWIDSLPGTPALEPPVIAPNGGNFDDAVQLTMTHPTGNVHYTLDGSQPDTGSLFFSGPFDLTQTAAVTARAFQTGFTESVSTTASFTITDFRDPENPAEAFAGMSYEQYLGTWDNLPDFDTLTPAEVGVRSNFDISPRLQNDNFAFRFQGFIDIPQTGLYTFYTNSDDGSQLFIGTDLVVENDGLHAPRETSGQIALEAGLHAITVTMFEKGGGEVLDVHYEGPGLSKTLVPDSALYYGKDPATVYLNDLAVVYDGNPVSVTASTDPPGLAVDITYEGDPTPPTNAGVYQVVATVNDPDYQGSASATLTIDQALATIVLGNLSQNYDGSPRSVSISTTPLGLTTSVTYDGSPAPPVDTGSYAVIADVIDPNYTGTSSDTLVIGPGSATVTLSGLTQTYDGTPRVVGAATSPTGLSVDVTYDGSSTPPTAVGSYAIVATVNDPNYTGSDSGMLVVSPGSATVLLANLTQTYDGTPRVVSTTTTPAGLTVDVTYDGSSTPPTEIGSYSIVATINDPNYTGSTGGTLVVNGATATVTLANLAQVYDGSPRVVSATTTPSGLAVSVTYNGSSTAPTDAGSYAIVATVTEPGYSGSTGGTLVVSPAAATVALTNLSQTHDGSPRVVGMTTTPSGLSVDITYNGSATAPTNAGSYAIVATVSDPNYVGSTNGTLVVSVGSATVALTGLNQVYDGTPRVVGATTTPSGLTADLTYDGSATPPTNAGSYAVLATVNDPNYTGSANGTLVVSPGSATVTLTGLDQAYDGTPRVVGVMTTPAGLTVDVTYDGSAAPPTNIGSYAVVANISDPNYTGSANGTLVVSPGAATVTLSSLGQTYDGTPRVAGVTTVPTGLSVDVTYDGSATPPTEVGSYAVDATVTDSNYTGSASGTLVVSTGSATVTLSGLSQPYDGTPRVVGVTTVPAGLTVDVTYDGSATAPSDAGSYSVVATINDPNYIGSNSGTLVVDPAFATVTLSGLSQTYDGTPRAVSAATSPAGLSVDLTYNGSATPPTNAGSYAIVATVTTPNYVGSTSDTLSVATAAATVIISNLNQTYDGTPRSVSVVTTPAGLPLSITYDGSLPAPTNAGSYAVLASVVDPNYTGAAGGTLVVATASATVTLTGLNQVYDGTPRSVGASTAPAGLAVDVTYNGSPTPPTNTGSYTVVATINDANHVGSTSGTLVVDPATATVTLTGLAQMYDGTPRVVAATTIPAGLAVDVTYDGSPTPPTAVGSYAIAATVNDANYVGSAGGTLVVAAATAAVTLSGLNQVYDGTPRVVTGTTLPSGLTVDVTYDGSPTPPVNVGTYTVVGTVNDPNYVGSATGPLIVSDLPGLQIDSGIVTDASTESWKTVNLQKTFGSMVVVCTPVSPGIPITTRVRNAAGSSFELQIARVDGQALPISSVAVHYLALEEGVYTAASDGVTMEAVKYNSIVTDENNSWQAEARNYANTYTNPVVIGQVMTANDPGFSVFWARGSSATNPPSSSSLYVGKHVAEDPNPTRLDETVGYVVFEAGSGMIGNVPFTAELGPDTILGQDDSPPYTYALSALPTAPVAAVACSAAMDGNNGGWPVLYGATPLRPGALDLVMEEDTLGDTERIHISEQAGYVVVGAAITAPPTVNEFSASPPTIMEGAEALLTWDTTGATSVSIDNGIGPVGVVGMVLVNPAETTTYTLTADGPAGTSTADVTITVDPTPDLPFDRGVISGLTSSSWTTVNLGRSYSSMVVVCTPNYDSSEPSMVVRVRNASGSSFEATLARLDGAGGTISGVSAHYMVLEEGAYTLATHGVKMEAVKYTSTATSSSGSWVAEVRGYSNSYTSPVVLGQVMTANDPDFSVFWCQGSSRSSPPSSSALGVGKTVAEDSDRTRANETIGYVVFEAGAGQIGTTPFVAALGSDSIRGFGNSPPYSYSLSGLSSVSAAIATMAAVDGGNGGWAVLYGASPVETSTLTVAIDEDQIRDTERYHTSEQVGYVVFE